MVGSRGIQQADLSADNGAQSPAPMDIQSVRRNPAEEKTRKPKRIVPYHCNLFEGKNEEGDPVRFVTVEHGMICEVLMTAGIAADAIALHECNNHYGVDGNLTEFPIAINQAIYVSFSETNDGNIDTDFPISLVVLPDDEKSLNYVPATPPQSAIYYYKLAALKADGDGVKLVRFLAGSHIFRRSGLTCDLVIRGCPTITVAEGETPEIITDGVIVARVAFLSGMAVSLELDDTRPLHDNLAEAIVEICCTPSAT